MRGLFVTGTGTEVGKTVVSSAVMIRYRHLAPHYWKPVQTGIESDDDTRTVERLSRGACIDRGIRLQCPLSPHLSARLAGETIVVDALRAMMPFEEPLLVEGAGGVLVPLNDEETMIDLIRELSLPALVVALNALGTINHTLLTIEALRARRIAIAGVVLTGGVNEDHRQAIERFGAVPVIDEMPRFEDIGEQLPVWAASRFDADGVLGRVLA